MELVQKGLRKLFRDGPLPFFKSTYRFLWKRFIRNSYVINVRYRMLYRLKGYRSIADPYKIIYINPQSIQKYSSEFGKWESVGKIAPGEWDKTAKPFTEMKKYQAVKERFSHGKTWEETGIFEYLLNKKESSGTIDGCQNKAELEGRYQKIDNLYENIKRKGYDESQHGRYDYIAVHIGRNGDLIFAGSGNHRLAISKILDLEEIPVWVRARHAKWQQVRERVVAKSNEELSEGMKSHLQHPDLQDLITE